MSWTQGYTAREDLPAYMVRWADSLAPEGSQAECITWYPEEPDVLVVHYYDDTKIFVGTKKFRLKKKEDAETT